jgi:hypothetical protein
MQACPALPQLETGAMDELVNTLLITANQYHNECDNKAALVEALRDIGGNR